jgi:ACS family hexuronate transporter-like MFS transporter
LPAETTTQSTVVEYRSGVAETIGKFRWTICGLIFFATTINYIDRQILALLKETLDKEFGLTNEQFGFFNAAFQLAYGFSFIGFGWFIDRFGTKVGYALSIVLWSIAAAGHALVGSVNGFIGARMALGFGEAGNFPAAIKATAQWFPKRERAFATSIFNSGTNVGAIIAPLTIPFIAMQWGWRAPFVAAGILGFIWLIFWWLMYDVPEKHKSVKPAELAFIRSDPDEAAQERKVPWTALLGYRQTWSFIVAKALTDPVWWFFLTWLPDYFKKTRGLVISKSYLHIVVIYTLVTVLSIFGGWVTGYLAKSGWSVTRARKTGMLVFALCVLPILAAGQVGDWTAVLLIGFGMAAHQAWSANLYTTVSDMFPKRAVASVTGLGGMSGSLVGFGFPIFAGKLLDTFKDNPNNAYAILFGICACAYVVAFIIHHLLAPKFEQIQLPAEVLA